ncbi:MAG TPA: threonine-phosphate decarboxylase CobD [Microvirga sp.]|jgi:cobalamin biosynthetic protein CobC
MEHGGDLHAAKAQFPEAPEPWLDLSTGINPRVYPFTPPPIEAFARLPSPAEAAALEAVAAQAYGISDPARVAAVSGSQALIQILPRLRPQGRVVVLAPTYSEHGRCWARAGHAVEEAPDLDAALARDPAVVVAVNPNNPDGRVIPDWRLLEAGRILAARGGWLVVDEAFADLEDEASVAPHDAPGIVVMRSLGKAYGLAGLRLGFAVAAPELAERIRQESGPWAVSGPALAIGSQALSDRAWLEVQKRERKLFAAELDRLLVAVGFRIEGGTRLFRLAAHADAEGWFQHLASHGILVRKFKDNRRLLRFGNLIDETKSRLNGALGNR